MSATDNDTIPTGWKLVPIDPTPAMLDEAVKGSRADVSYFDAEEAYRAMLDIAPPPPCSPDRSAAPVVSEDAFERGKIVGETVGWYAAKGDKPPSQWIDIVFDGPPGPEAGRFVEVENTQGQSIRCGDWAQRPDGYWVLRITALPSGQPQEDRR